jgi:CRISPR-associated endonuclease/helicase Cas3
VIEHSLDVALAAARLVASPVLHSRLETAYGHGLSDTQLARLACLAGLHDCGKTLWGFQQRISGQGIGTSHLAEVLACLWAEPRTLEALRVPLLST